MKLTAKDVAKATKLSLTTVRVYASQRKIGTKEGGKRFFSKADIKKFTASAQSSRPNKPKSIKKTTVKIKPVARQVPQYQPEAKPVKRSFWDSLLNRKPQKKTSVVDLAKR